MACHLRPWAKNQGFRVFKKQLNVKFHIRISNIKHKNLNLRRILSVIQKQVAPEFAIK